MKSLLLATVCLSAFVGATQLRAETSRHTSPASDMETTQVVVTGEKISRTLGDTQSSVSVANAQRIGAENIQSVYDLANRTANMSETLGQTGFSLRGVSNHDVLGAGAGALATLYVDGAALPSRAAFAGPLDMWDVAQVEIFRGPQSTLQGKNALAGAIHIRSKDPSFTPEASGRLILSDQGDRATALAFGGPLMADQVAFRVSAQKRDTDGLIHNPTRNRNEDAYDGLQARAKLLIRPAAIPRLEASATFTHSDVRAGYVYSYARTDVPDYYDNRINTSNRPNTTHNTTDIYTLEARYALSDTLSLTGVTSYNRFANHYAYDLDATEIDASYGSQEALAKTFTHEVRLTYQSDRFNGLIGLYQSDRDGRVHSEGHIELITPVDTIIGGLRLSGVDEPTSTLVANLYASAMPVIPVASVYDAPETVENTAVFMDGTWQVTPSFSIIGGLRFDRETYGIGISQTTRFAGTYPDPAMYPDYLQGAIYGINAMVEAQVALASSGAATQPRVFEAWLPKLGVKYAFDEDRSLSFTAQRGYRSGGTAINLARSTAVPYDPEYTTNYELAWRSLWFDNTLMVNANAYYTDWTDQQVRVFMGLNEYDYETKNAGSSHLYGFELELAQRVNAHFDWYASVGHAFTRFDEFTVDQGTLPENYEGKRFAHAPRWTLAGGATWRGNNGVFANLNASYRSAVYQDAGNTVEIKARTLANAKLGYETPRWAAYVYANNLLGAKYKQAYWPNENMAMLGAPRTIGVILEARY